MIGEMRLFQEVIQRALMDAFWTGNERGKNGVRAEVICNRNQADTWLRGMSEDFKMVCDLAGVDPQYLRDNYVAGKIDRNVFYNAQAAKNKSDSNRWKKRAAA